MSQTLPGIIFDLDGTLIDTLDDITDSLNDVLVPGGWGPLTRDRVRSIVGEGLRTLMARATGCDDADRLRVLIDNYRPRYRVRMLNHTRLYQGVAKMLDELMALAVPCCVLSNKPDEFTKPICAELLRRWRFTRVLGAVEEARRKPDPRGALELAAAMRKNPAEVLFVGDSDTDVRTGRNAGMTTISVIWGYRNREVLKAAQPDHIISRPGELVRLLDQRRDEAEPRETR